MKKILLLSQVFLFLMTFTATAQTKEQTIDWLNKYGNDVLDYYQVNGVKLLFESEYDGSVTLWLDWNSSVVKHDEYKFNLRDLDPSVVIVNFEEFAISCSSISCIDFTQYLKSGGSTNFNKDGINLSFKSQKTDLDKFKNDSNVERFYKALKHAIELYGGSTVKEDLFDG